MRKLAVVLLFLCACLFAGAAQGEGSESLGYNSSGEAVLALQERLTELGYYTFRITGVYQENTQRAVRAFQEAHGFPVTGVADDALQRFILSPLAEPKPTPTPAPTPSPAPTLNLYVDYPGRLSYGSGGDHVRRVQTRLSELGFYTLQISGNFLDNTQKAVKAFQRHNGLLADGIVGESTWQMLFFGDALSTEATPRPTPSPTPVPYRLGVDVTNQVITVYGLDEEGAHTHVLRRMICSTGTERDPTPLKTFVLNGATSRWCYFPKWGTHAQYWTRIDAANAFHSVIYTEPHEMALAVGSYTGLGKRASHGCIRLMLEDAKWIYQNCGKGTEVTVYEGAPDEELTKSLRVPPLDKSRMLPVPTPAPTDAPAYREDALPPMPFATLQRGMESEAVYFLQCKLAELGYYTGTITGGYYSGTEQAVRAFQRDHALSVDGKAGTQTQGKLYEALLATPSPEPTAAPTLTPTPTPAPSPEGAVWFPVGSPSPAPTDGQERG